jgi:hypothetical protein
MGCCQYSHSLTQNDNKHELARGCPGSAIKTACRRDGPATRHHLRSRKSRRVYLAKGERLLWQDCIFIVLQRAMTFVFF